MSEIITAIKLFLVGIIYSPIILKANKSKNRLDIVEDVDFWYKMLDWTSKGGFNRRLIRLLFYKPQFRNLLFYRIKSHSSILKLLCKPDYSLEIATNCDDIEGGSVYFEHAFGSHLQLQHIGKGCMIRQLTTFGVKSRSRKNERPWVGRNVDFGANVTCIGNIRIGDNAVIAAGSIVVKDVPDNAIVAGNPAKVIGYNQSCGYKR